MNPDYPSVWHGIKVGACLSVFHLEVSVIALLSSVLLPDRFVLFNVSSLARPAFPELPRRALNILGVSVSVGRERQVLCLGVAPCAWSLVL